MEAEVTRDTTTERRTCQRVSGAAKCCVTKTEHRMTKSTVPKKICTSAGGMAAPKTANRNQFVETPWGRNPQRLLQIAASGSDSAESRNRTTPMPLFESRKVRTAHHLRAAPHASPRASLTNEAMGLFCLQLQGTARNEPGSTLLGFAVLASLALLVFQESPGLSSRSQRVPSTTSLQSYSEVQDELDVARSAALQLTAEIPGAAGGTFEDETSLEDSINQPVPGDACKANLASMSHREKVAFFEQHLECSFLNTCGAYLEPSNRTDLVEELQHSYIYRFDDEIRYTHMAMIERLSTDE
jgi:hypothetical protein